MLVLTRRIGESLLIGDDITVTVLDVRGGQTRIGIGAPRNVSVNRQEVQDRIDRERDNESAGDVAVPLRRANRASTD